MATMNPFDLLGDDAEDPSQLAVALPQKALKTEKPAAAQPAKASKMPTKPLPPAQAVREAKNPQSGGRGGGRGFGRGGRGGGFNRDSRNNDFSGNENGYSRGYRHSEDGEVSENRGTVGGFRGRGGRRGGFSNGDGGDGERPRRMYERRSGTGRGNEFKRDGSGRGNWGTPEDEIPPATEEPAAEAEKKAAAEKEGGGDKTADVNEEAAAEEKQEKEPEDKEMTLEEYEKVMEEKRKALQASKMEERKVDAKEFESMQQLSNKKSNDEVFIKLGSEKDKRRETGEKEEKAKKAVSINEFLKPAEGESYNARGYRGRGGRGGGYGYGGNRYGGGAAPSIQDPSQFPTLAK